MIALSIGVNLGITFDRGLGVRHQLNSFDDFGLDGAYWVLIAAASFVAIQFLPLVSPKWLIRVAVRRIPPIYLILAGVVSGCFAGVGYLSLAFVSNSALRQMGILVLVLIGPLPGVMWLVLRQAVAPNRDYDDEMKPVEPSSSIEIGSLTATEEFGRRLGSLLFPNTVIALIGPLGAGKTHLSRAIAEGLGVANPAAVTSPTFTLIHEYPARLPIYHFDAYRLNNADQFLDLGATEYYEAGGVCLIEWADRVEAALPEERLTIRIEIVDENRRRIEMLANGEKYKQLLASRAP
jgi:tRNA threonylcarbamoyladenosine biosynthesis protein TsaE